MTEKKKRGLLSWLGFGDDDQVKQPEPAQSEEVISESDEITVESVEPIASQEVVEEAAVEPISEPATEEPVEVTPVVVEAPRVQEQEKPTESFFARLKRSLSRTKANIGAGFFGLFKGKKIDDDLFEELEEQLLVADVGMDTTLKIIENLTEKASRRDLKDGEALYGLLKEEMAEILSKVEQPLQVDSSKTPYVILMVGVNGVGKTTTIGKLAKQFQNQGKKVMLAAGDTFRAAAVEQLQVWGERNNVPVIAQHTGADSASVIYDAIEAAKARGVDVVIADTAGRLQNKSNLMEELRKIVRVMKKIDDSAPHEIMLTLDAGTGQNAISQAKLFSDVAPITGITLTKLDGTAKGGVIFAIADQFNIPIRYIGVGEGIEDLRPFETQEFIDALFSREE
ncbi:signal recognition particle-docking protein FtsY [Vibrio vulnificus]|uniref:signal recognition particle-docking protein FtsY n=1 Tax=Vibrio vulnificus TaxID=672 RepID=UPI0019D42E4D|nr:signal recognition particle-docking protein FtsY [Vibrio vulnificus]EGR0109556.1 signal recognition particle-docking protein FtsY [Vibrio vulnificus]EIF5018436.1 signal recognition particle-docking protein FtsY [Vibrio vulnificus]EIO2324471.1 signal recognition particle-docking protein FtsY [Vibrio vulnificus]EIO4069308.1 signal recognition particle-docking protein FtsY [Vibrio vulnificus]EJT0555198.1 signal recognition particle-docking protein FtsY [Vibrio vulnificus]